MMRVSDLFSCSELISEIPTQLKEAVVASITTDSREILPGSLYFCILGAKFDGRVFIKDAIQRGAIGVVYEGELLQDAPENSIKVRDIRRALSCAAHKFFGVPSLALRNIAVTGTSGKTSVSWILAHALRTLGERTFIGGTLAFKVLEDRDATAPELKELSNTTMDPISVHRLLRDAVQGGAKTSVFEATSQGIVQSRMRDVAWDGAIFTNLSRDHMDLHGTMEKYEDAKRRLFVDELVHSPKTNKFAILNYDDPAGRRIGSELRVTHPDIRTISLSRLPEERADFTISRLEASTSGLRFSLTARATSITVSSSLVGEHNAYNIALAAIALLEIGFAPSIIADALASTPAVPGRLERVQSGSRKVYVDYAHKPDALEKVLSFLKPLCRGRLICIMGCGGDRDKGKRPLMGEIARRLADVTVVTSDNPRTENPDEIIQQIVSGIPAREEYPLIVEVDRSVAIRKAIEISTPEDIVVIAGKGHEPYQEVMGVKYPFNDAAVARSVLLETQTSGDTVRLSNVCQ